uniref:DNA-directed RNA polymerase subunit alpha n=1 Tax=Crepidomanes minutum TaxID=32127 RepID=A0A8K1RY78_9MONI|nr:RNA polymerase alpha subunit [Crepidomanes minutum]UEQ13219.1 RNA polymerase alpha subunit [Crepidomanes minutum]
MIQDEIPISTQIIQWSCIESKVENKRLHYGRFAISPLKRGQVNTVGMAMRRSLLSEVGGTGITYARFETVSHEYSTITGIQETIHDILVNLREIVLRSDSYDIQKAFLCVNGPKKITASDISLPSSVKVIDDSQYIATITQSISLNIELKIEKDRGYRVIDSQGYEFGEFPIDAIFMPVLNVNYSVHQFGNNKEMSEILFIEIWTNGSLTPNEAFSEASKNLIDLFLPFLHTKHEDIVQNSRDPLNSTELSYPSNNEISGLITEEATLKHIFIDQLESPARAYNCLKRIDIHTISDLLDYSQEDLQRIKNFGRKSIDQVSKALRERFSIDLPKNKSYINRKKENES